jgi:predicted metal-dependent hydrolase
MVKSIKIQNRVIEYQVKRSYRARNLRLVVNYDGRLQITTPFLFPNFFVERFIMQKFNWIIAKIDYVTKLPHHKTFPTNSKEYKALKEKSFNIIKGRLEYYRDLLGYDYNRVTIKNQKTCWGSCSKKKNLNFNYKTALLPDHLRDYIIVHELCHLKELNHSSKFWNLVAQIYPNHRELRKELRKTNVKL